jgi:hypothetical protein
MAGRLLIMTREAGMRTYGANPFSTDFAVDYLGELADVMCPEERRRVLVHIFSHGPARLGRARYWCLT